MARVYGQIYTSIWRDPDFIGMPSASQRLFMLLFSQGDISSCGTLPMTLRRWSKMAPDTPIDTLSGALSTLVAKGFVVVDEDTEELLIRSFIKWDGGYKVPKRLIAILAVARSVGSALLVQVIARELHKLGIAHDLAPDTPIDTDIDTPIDIAQVPGYVTEVDTGTRNQEPEPGTRNLEPARTARRSQGSRLPDDWQPDDDLIAFVKRECPNVNGRIETENFRDYWHAKSGKDATKLDWKATYRKWMRTAQQRTPKGRASPARSTTDERVRGHLALAERFAAQEPDHDRLEITP